MAMKQEITGHTALYCLLGSPVAHSISPQMHNASFLHHGIDARYLAFDVKPEQLADAIKASDNGKRYDYGSKNGSAHEAHSSFLIAAWNRFLP